MPWCSNYWKGSLQVALNYGRQLYYIISHVHMFRYYTLILGRSLFLSMFWGQSLSFTNLSCLSMFNVFFSFNQHLIYLYSISFSLCFRFFLSLSTLLEYALGTVSLSLSLWFFNLFLSISLPFCLLILVWFYGTSNIVDY